MLEAETPQLVEKPQSMKLKILVEWLVVIIVAVVVATVVRMFLLQQFYISGPSMETTMFGDDRVLVNKFAYRLGEIDRGDIIVFDRITVNGSEMIHDDLIKRVIGLGGETISIKNCVVFINSVELDEPYLPARDRDKSTPNERCGTADLVEQEIELDSVFLMGDNRPESYDSRSFGAVKKEQIVGEAFVVIWPPSNWDLH